MDLYQRKNVHQAYRAIKSVLSLDKRRFHKHQKIQLFKFWYHPTPTIQQHFGLKYGRAQIWDRRLFWKTRQSSNPLEIYIWKKDYHLFPGNFYLTVISPAEHGDEAIARCAHLTPTNNLNNLFFCILECYLHLSQKQKNT